MAVPEQTPYIEHTGNGVATSFSLGFQCESKDHLIVLVDDIEPPIATWSLTGGNVVFTTAPAAGKKITLQRNTPFNRTAEYQSFNNSFRPKTVNVDFDRIWLKLQELGVADWLLKLYVDRLHQQQEQKINNLKTYVDDKDDELRAYLLEEIRKQGVALDQLDDYYNYLMQRLAQIAIDKGWDASFVVDASGKTQQQINDGLSSIAEMLAIRNPKNGNRVFVVGYYAGSLLGGGDFVYSKTSTLTADNGIVFDCPDGGKWIRLHKGKLDFYAYGAKFDGVTDDTQSITNALRNEYYKHIQHYEDGVAIITARTERMPKGMTVSMGANSWIRINNPAGDVFCFFPADDCELKVNIDGGQLPLSGNVSDEWIGSNNFGIFTTVPEHNAASFANINVKNVKITGSKFKNIVFPVRADGSDGWDISGNLFHKIKQSGILMGASALGGVYRNKIHHNTFIELGDTAAAANHLNGLAAKSGQIECVSMTNNYVRDSQLRTGGSPFDFEGVTAVGESFGHLIANNIVEQLDTRPIPDLNMRGLAICGSNVQAVTIVNNVLKGSGADRGVAISITSTFDCVVKGNTVINNYGGGVSLVGSTGATVSDNDLIDSQGSSNNSPAILIASFANDLRTDNFTVTNNKIRNTSNYVRSGISDAISCNFGITSNALELNGVISGNTIHDPNGNAISVIGSVDRQISGLDITGNSVFSKYDTAIIYVSRAFDVNVSGLYARGGRGIRLSRCDGESVRLSDMDLKVTGLLFNISGCLNLNISDSKVVTSSASIFSDPSQFTDATKNNRMVNVTGSINSENKGRGVYTSASTAIAHGLTLPPKGINITPLTAGVTGLRVYGIGSQNFYVEYGGVVDAEFMWSASI